MPNSNKINGLALSYKRVECLSNLAGKTLDLRLETFGSVLHSGHRVAHEVVFNFLDGSLDIVDVNGYIIIHISIVFSCQPMS